MKRILLAYGTSVLGVFSGLLTNLFLLKIITVYVSKTEYGLYAFIIQITTYFSVLQLGLDFALSRQIAEYLGKDQNANANLSYWEVKKINKLGFIVVPVITVSLAFLIWFKIIISNDETFRLATILIILSGIVQTILFANRPNSAVLIGSKNQSYVNIINVSRTILSTTLSILLLYTFKEIYLILISEVLTHSLAYFALKIRLNRKCEWVTKEKAEHSAIIFKKLLKFGSISTLGGIAWTIEGTSDVILLGSFGNLQIVGLYVIWWRFPSMLFDLCTRLAFSSYPEFAERHSHSLNDISTLLSKVLLISLFLGSLSYIGISLWLTPFINIWFGNEYLIENTYLIALMMGLLILLRTVGNLLGMFLLSTGDATYPTKISFLQAVTKVVISLILVGQFSISGIVLASIVASLIQIVMLGWKSIKNSFIGLDQIVYFVILTLITSICIYVAKDLIFQVINFYTLIFGMIITIIIWTIMYIGFSLLSPFKNYTLLILNKFFKFKTA
jgi:O-antigen/teichoic acid export membrane protein